MDIKKIKKKYNLTDSDIASFFSFKTVMAYRNSSAKKRYELAIERIINRINKSKL